jgi:GNAT superfamily N-acetyltransferase
MLYYLLYKTTITCSYNKKLDLYEHNIISKYITEEYITATDYLLDNDTIHFYIIDNDVLISYLHVTKNTDNKHFINYMYTNKNHRNKGYMKKLLNYALDICKKHNINSVYSWTKHKNNNSKKTFYSNDFMVHNYDHMDITFVKHL